MKISNTDGEIKMGGFQLTLDMTFIEIQRVVQELNFEESTLKVNGKIEGAIFYNHKEKLVDSWLVYLQVQKQHGMVSASLTYTDENFPLIPKWDAELEERRKQKHIEFLSEWGLKRKSYPWGSASVVKDRSYKFAAIVLYFKKIAA